MSITALTLEVIDPRLLVGTNAAETLGLIKSNARNKFQIFQDWQKFIEDRAIAAAYMQSPQDEACCQWCKRIAAKAIKKDFNLPQKMEIHCTCVWFRGKLEFRVKTPGLRAMPE